MFYLRLERRGHALETRPLPEGVQAVEWLGGHGPARWTDGPRLLIDLKRVIRTIQPDLVQAGPIQRSALLAALSGFQPLISMSWGYDLLFDAYRNPAWRWATRYTLQHSAVLLGDSHIIRRKATEFGMAPERIVTFPWGVDLQHFIPANPNSKVPDPSSKLFTLLSTRSWEPIYGVEVIARGFVSAVRQCPAVDLRLVMLGNGSQAGLLRQIFEEAGVIERVTLVGHVDQVELRRQYQSADLYLSASHSDGSSISLLEALACGCPVLVSDIPGNREWVIEDEVGWLFPDGDAEALAQMVLKAIENRTRLPEMGRAARQLAEDRADWDKNFQQMEQVYQLAMQTVPRTHSGGKRRTVSA